MSMQISSTGGGSPIKSESYPNESVRAEVSKDEGKDTSEAISTTEALRLAEQRGIEITQIDEQSIKAIDRAIKAVQGPDRTLEFSVHKQTNAIMIKVVNKETGELIREIPPEKSLDFVAKLMKRAGLLIDHKV